MALTAKTNALLGAAKAGDIAEVNRLLQEKVAAFLKTHGGKGRSG